MSGRTCCRPCREASGFGKQPSRRWALTEQGRRAVTEPDTVRVPVLTREGLREIARHNARSLELPP